MWLGTCFQQSIFILLLPMSPGNPKLLHHTLSILGLKISLNLFLPNYWQLALY